MPDLASLGIDPATLMLVVAAFAIAGAIKGVVGLGLPTVSAAIMASLMDLRTAIAILVIPLVVTNFVQVVQGGPVGDLLRRFGVLNLAAAAGLWAGTEILFAVDPARLQIGLGALLIVNAIVQVTGFQPRVGRLAERRWALPVGFVSGVIGGTTGSQGIVIAVWLHALELSRDQYVQGVGLSFFLTGLVWAAAILAKGGMTAATLPMSAVALAVALAAMAGGRTLRGRLPEARFRQAVFIAMALLGANLIRRGVMA